jgi:type I restriction enzyme S subunit
MLDNGLPHEWTSQAIGDLARERIERSPNSTAIPVYSVTKHRGFVPSLEYFDRQVFSRNTANYKVVRKGDIAYATIHLDEGSIGLLESAELGLISPMYTVIEVDQERIAPRYLFALLKQPAMLREYFRIKEGTVHRRWSVSFKDLAKVQVVVPGRRDQDAVLEVLDSIDAAIEKTEAVIAATERLRSALLAELLTRGVPGWHTEWKQVPRIGTIPACWDVVRLGEVAPISYGTSVPTSHTGVGLPVLRIPNVARGVIDLTDLKFALDAAIAEPEACKDDLLIVRTNGNPQICGTFALVSELPGKFLFASYLMRIRMTNRALRPGFFAAFLNTTGRAQLRGRIRTSAGNYNVSASGLASVEVSVPGESEQARMIEALDVLDARRRDECTERDRLMSVKQGLAEALLSGRVRTGVATEEVPNV